MKAVIDTNIFFSAIWRTGSKPHQILVHLLDGAFDLILSTDLEQEMRRILTGGDFLAGVRWTASDSHLFVDRLRSIAERVEPGFTLTVLRDESDNRLLEAAQAAEADYLVTGDKPILDLGTFGQTQIVTAAHFLELLDSGTS